MRPVDLADLSSVEAFVSTWTGPLHLLVNNAGLVTGGLERTGSGRELQLATNHLGHHALANGLHGALAAGAAHLGAARVVVLSSTAHMRSDASLADHPHGVKEWALDPALAERLWVVSDALIAA